MRAERAPAPPGKRTTASPGSRQARWVGPGLLHIRQRVAVRGRKPGTDVTGPFWVFAVVRVHKGVLRYRRGGELVSPLARRFAVFMPPWSIVRAELAGCAASTEAIVASKAPFDGAPDSPVIWPWPGGALPTSLPAIAAAVRGGGPLVPVSREVEAPEAARRAKAAIDAAYSRPVTLERLAAQLGLSASFMSRAFKQAYGLTAVEYRHRLRVVDAMVRLAAGGKILTVLGDVGFGDASRLYQHFRSLLCAPPGSYSALRSRNAKT